MRWRDIAILFLIALGALLAASQWVSAPGYMDAEYYTAGGLQLAGGRGFQEPFLWNYLDQPQGIPHLSHTYWMPLASLVAAAGLAVGGSLSFPWAQAPFLLLGALVPPLTAQLSFRLSGCRWFGWIAGLMAVCSGYYLNLLVTTETFTLYMVLGCVFFLLAFPERISKPGVRAFALGLVVGLMHLSRADGIVWLAAAAGVIVWWGARDHSAFTRLAVYAVVVAAGYLLVMAPWYARNLMTFDALFSPGGSRTLWLTGYNATFAYPADSLTPAAWWQAGIAAHVKSRLWALGFNLKNLLGVQTLVVMLPMILIGGYRLRKRPEVALTAGMWLLTLFVMTVVFPFAGARGGFLHSGAALQPAFWALAPIGLAALVEMGERARGWDRERSIKVFSVALVAICLLVTLVLFWSRVIGPDPANPVWLENTRRYAAVDRALDSLGFADDAIIMVNNPPGFFLATGRPSIVIPGGDLESVLHAAQDYRAQALVLEVDQENLADLYLHPADGTGLLYQIRVGDVHLFAIAGTEAEAD